MQPKKLDDLQAEKLLKRYRIPLARQLLARNGQQAAAFARKIGFPVVLKVSSPDVIHKTDVNGVVTGVNSETEAADAFATITRDVKRRLPRAAIRGVAVQEMVRGHEVIIGSKQDPQFGPVLMFGLGGIFVQVFRDVTFRVIPIERRDARQMIGEIRGAQIFRGLRGQKPANTAALEDCLLAVSRMVWATRKIRELDLNPVFVNEKGVKAVDVRILT